MTAIPRLVRDVVGYSDVMEPLERMINIEVSMVLDEDAIPRWWNLWIPALQCTPREAYDRGDGQQLLEYVQTYSDPSFT